MSKRNKNDDYIDLDDEEDEDPLAVKLSFHSQLSRHSQSILPGLADLMMDPDMLEDEDIGGGASDDEEMLERPKKKKDDEEMERMIDEEFEEIEAEIKKPENPEELEVKDKGSTSSNGTMFDYENSDSSAEPGQDSP
jgi:hypothetical protein